MVNQGKYSFSDRCSQLTHCSIEEWNRIKKESSNVLAAIDPADPERTRHLVLESVAQCNVFFKTQAACMAGCIG